MNDIWEELKTLESETLSSEQMNDVCGEYVNKHKERLTTEDVFYLVRFALSGNPVGAPMADIAEVVGKQ